MLFTFFGLHFFDRPLTIVAFVTSVTIIIKISELTDFDTEHNYPSMIVEYVKIMLGCNWLRVDGHILSVYHLVLIQLSTIRCCCHCHFMYYNPYRFSTVAKNRISLLSSRPAESLFTSKDLRTLYTSYVLPPQKLSNSMRSTDFYTNISAHRFALGFLVCGFPYLIRHSMEPIRFFRMQGSNFPFRMHWKSNVTLFMVRVRSININSTWYFFPDAFWPAI